jgi:deoxyribodipyrimidine photo-lyase
MIKKTSVVWFRNDLRLDDNPALAAAFERGGPVIPLFIWSPEEEGGWAPGSASCWWLHRSLVSLDRRLRERGSRLTIRTGPSDKVLGDLAKSAGAASVFWNRRYEPAIIERDRGIQERLRRSGFEAESFNGALLHEPQDIRNKSGKPYQVFTPFWKACLATGEPPPPLPGPDKLTAPTQWPPTLGLDELGLQPKIQWADDIALAWTPGGAGARAEMERFLKGALFTYDDDRNRPDFNGTSRLSPHLHFGEISPRQVWHSVRECAEKRGIQAKTWRHWQYLTEIGWREFAHQLLYHFPHTPEKPLRSKFDAFPWRTDPVTLKAWQKGATGYPVVDAGMRQLWATGWMHNRIRMVVASFLVKNLLIPWQEGARWFWDTLVDADLAQNTSGWQWTAGCGADAAPFFRIFNAVSQGEKFDPEGAYVRSWIPELAKLPNRWIHKPWEAPGAVLSQAGVELGRTYPERIVSHAISREIALQAYAKLK